MAARGVSGASAASLASVEARLSDNRLHFFPALHVPNPLLSVHPRKEVLLDLIDLIVFSAGVQLAIRVVEPSNKKYASA